MKDLRGLSVDTKDAPTLASIPEGPEGGNSTSSKHPNIRKGFKPSPKDWPPDKEERAQEADKKTYKDKAPAGILPIQEDKVMDPADMEPNRPLGTPLSASLLDDDADDVLGDKEEESSLLEPNDGDDEIQDPRSNSGLLRAWRIASHHIGHFVRSNSFSYLTTTVVLMNCLLIGAQTDFLIQNLNGDHAPSYFGTLDGLFCALFTTELCCRFMAFGWSFFWMEGWGWNIFDLVVVSMQLIDIILHACFRRLNIESDPSTDRMLMLLRLLRLLRIMRLMRVLRLVDELRTIVSGIVGSLKSLFWTLVLLTLGMYAFGVCVTQLVADHLISVAEIGGVPATSQNTQDLKYWYGSLVRTVLSLFEAICGGVSWDAMVNPLLEDVSWVMVLFYCIYIAFCLFAVMNSVTGVFCEKATQKVRADQEEFLANVCRKTFAKNNLALGLKPRHEQLMTWKEFSAQMHTLEFRDFFKAIDVCASEAEGLFSLLDVERKGAIDFEQFMHGILKLRGPAKSLDLTLLMNETDQMYGSITKHMKSVDDKLNTVLRSMSDV